MNFHRSAGEEPELNLIPLIDVLIILMIFLFLTTSFERHRGLKVQLPEAAGAERASADHPIRLAISAEGSYDVAGTLVDPPTAEALKSALKVAAGGRADPLLIIEADRASRHQSLMTLLDLASQLGYRRISFAAQIQPPP